MQRDRRDRHRRLGRSMAGALVLVMALAGQGVGAGAAAAAPTGGPAGQAAPVSSTVLTLLTGDLVQLDQLPGGRQSATVQPAERADHRQPEFETIEIDGQLYVIPSDAAPLVDGVLDRELFNVTKLAEYGYRDGVPVIVDYDRAPATLAAPAGFTRTTSLPSIDAVAGTIDASGDWWAQAAARLDANTTATAGGPLAGVDRVWLDEIAEVSLAESVPQIGAPDAWDAGYDGTGTTVAVLDTGVDTSHPDLAGKVADERNFTSEADARDGHGHGTHVSGTVAGSGAASSGQYTGVAPGAQLLNGKVCNSSGNCVNSEIISGMEWAAAADADVISMSIGGGPTDGTDPLSQAVNQLTEQHDVLFVIAAGNRGSAEQSVSSPGTADAALTVGAVDKSDQLASFSGRGPRVGDYAIKPDVTAPGVSIVAPRGAGTSMGSPVNDDYTAANGTSMATPHVSGAAAILLQRHPDLTPEQAKAALTTTAEPNSGLHVYQQGGGRILVPAALDTPLIAPGTLSLGYFQYPHDDAEPRSAQVSYANISDQPVTVDLSFAVTDREGQAPADGMLTVTPSTLTVAAGESATATVTVDVQAGEYGIYGGYLVAEQDGQPVTRTPVGFYKESERYQLTVRGTARDGRPAAGISSFDVINAEDTTTFLQTSNGFGEGGTTTMRVPPGTYAVLGVVYTYDGPIQFTQERVMLGDPEVEVTEDTTVVLDARQAEPVSVHTTEHESAPTSTQTVAFYRAAAQRGSFSHSYTGSPQPQFAVPTDPVTIGGFEYYNRWRLGAPSLVLSVVDPVELELAPDLMSGSPAIDGDDQFRLVDVGFGDVADYEGVDVDGAAVLTRRGGPNFATKESIAVANGAAALIVANDVSGNFSGSVGSAATIPTMSVSMEQGDQLVDLVADHDEVTVRLRGTALSPFMYDLVLAEPDRVPADLSYQVETNQLATVHNGFHSDVPDHEMNEVRHFWRPWSSFSFGVTDRLPAPQQRTEYLIPGDTRYQQQMWAEPPFTGQLLEPVGYYTSGETRRVSWFKQLTRPGILEGGPAHPAQPTLRDGDTLTVRVQEWVDASGHWGGPASGVDSTAFRLYQDDELIAEAPRAQGAFEVSADPAEYRLELDVDREADWWTTSTSTRTAWTVQSRRPSGGAEVVPLLLLDYDVDLDLLNTAPAMQSGAPTMELRVRHQPGADGAAIRGARVWVSFDGSTWQPRPALSRGDGEYRVILPNRAPGGADTVSLRVEAWDAAGNRINQEVTDAWQLSGR